MNASVTAITRSSVEETKSEVDSSWTGVYRISGISLMLAGILVLASTTFGTFLGIPPGNNDAYLQSLANHPTVAQLLYWFWVLIDVLLFLGTLGLFLALKGIHKNVMLIASAITGFFLILDLGITELNSLTLITLTQAFASATSDAQRAVYLAAEHWGLATIPTASFFSWIGPSVGFFIIAILMWNSSFSKFTASLGIISNGLALICAFYFLYPIPFLSIFLTPILVVYGVWHVSAGRRLFKLGRTLREA
jgi:hypothetical protein